MVRNPLPLPVGKIWLVTGGAGFIGSHLVESLLIRGQKVRLVDNFITGRRDNISDVRQRIASDALPHLEVIEGDIRDRRLMEEVTRGVDFILHQAALGSVPRSVKDPWTSHDINVNGFVSIIEAARAAGVKRIVYASSSSVYGDHPQLPKTESLIGVPLSPYAATKRTNEIYADAYAKSYGLTLVGLRYFNVFGYRQNPEGEYAAVIPRWIDAILHGRTVEIYGDGETSRDFCYIKNVVAANLAAATSAKVTSGSSLILNIATHQQPTLNELFSTLAEGLQRRVKSVDLQRCGPKYLPFRAGDIRHSLADITLAYSKIDYVPDYHFKSGIEEYLDSFCLTDES